MAFVPGFANDVFISYAHIDNTEGWVDIFDQRLRNRLQQFERNAGVVFWRDLKLRGADIFSAEIDSQLRNSAALISILSPNGVDSNWCQQERQRFEFAAAVTGGFRIDNSVRALKVTKTPLANDHHRTLFQTLGYEFYERLSTNRFIEYQPESSQYASILDRLAQDLWNTLTRLRARRLAPGPALTVYLASVPGELESWREAILHQLTAWNCRVLPEGSLPSSSPRLRNAIDETLVACRLSIHCVGAQRGFIPEGEESSIDVLQLERARAKSVDRIVFQGQSMHAAAASALERGVEPEERITPGRIDILLQTLEDRIRSLSAAPSSGGALPTVFVMCDICEWDVALRIKACLEAERQFAALLPIRDVDDERVRIRDLRETLKIADAIVVYWGIAREEWFRDQFREIISAQKRRRRRPLLAICLSSPPDPARQQYRRPDLPFAQVSNLSCETLNPFLRDLDVRATGPNK